MICNFTHFSIALLWFLPVFSSAQTEPMDLSLEQSLTLLRSENKSLRIAGKEVELAKNEHQKLNAFWYPTISAAGAYVHMSNPIEVRQSRRKNMSIPSCPTTSLSHHFSIRLDKTH